MPNSPLRSCGRGCRSRMSIDRHCPTAGKIRSPRIASSFRRAPASLTHADIDLVLRVRADNIWTPGVFASVERFFCSHYFAHFGRLRVPRRVSLGLHKETLVGGLRLPFLGFVKLLAGVVRTRERPNHHRGTYSPLL